MFTKLEDALKNDKLKKVLDLHAKGQLNVMKIIKAGTLYYRVQDAYHDGNGVYFSDNETRFSISDKSKGAIYLAESPHTGLHEVFQKNEIIDSHDLATNCMAEIEIKRDLQILNISQLAPHLGIPVGELMNRKELTYPLTQQMAQELCEFADGMEYLSRQNGERCLVLWSDNQGEDMLLNKSVTPLSSYMYGTVSARSILRQQCGIQIT